MAEIAFRDVVTPTGFDLAFMCSQGMGWRVVPAALGKKFPTLKRWPELATTNLYQVAAWWLWLDASEAPQNFSSNVCVATGRESGIWVLDVDPRHGGDESLAALEAEYGQLPETLVVDTPSGGQHYYWAYPVEGEIGNAANLHTANGKAHGLDVRGRGGQVMSPFSRLTAGIYMPRNAVEPVHAPAWLEDLAVTSSRSLTSGEGYNEAALPSVDRMIESAADVAAGGQEDHLFRFLCKLRQGNRSPEEMVDLGWELASRFPNEAGHPKGEWTREDVEAKVDHVTRNYEAGQTASEAETAWARGAGQTRGAVPLEIERARDEARNVSLPERLPSLDRISVDLLRSSFICNHAGLAKVFLSLWLEDVKWSQEEQRFMVFNHRDGHWVHDGKSHEAVHRLVNELATRVHVACENAIESDEAIQRLMAGNREDQAEGRRREAAVRSWAKVLSGTGNIRSVISAVVPAANDCAPQDFDRLAHLLNVRNGTYDVTTGELREHRQADMLTHRVEHELDLTLAEKPLEEVAPVLHELLWRMCGAPGELDETVHAARYAAVCRYLGYQLHGANPAKKLGVFIGASNIAKNQVLEIVGELLGELAFMAAKPSLLTRTRNDRHDGDESPLRSRRMVVLNELSSKQVLDENQVLRFVNPEGSVVSLRRMRLDPVVVPITWKITTSTNDLPRGELTQQIQNRLAVFPLSQISVPSNEQWDIKGAILRGGTHPRTGKWHDAEVNAVLAHLVRWWREWWVASQEAGAENGGLLVTDEMREALASYVEDNKPLHELFVEERLNLSRNPGDYVDSAEVVERYNIYVQSQHKDKDVKYAGGRRVLFKYLESLPGVARVERPRGKQAPRLLGYRGVSFVSEEPQLGELYAVAAAATDIA
ncbi:bifunctional DNA primase/polymerase [Streptomyces sp. B1-3]|uniref:bifunctional DNA primase/polymerase n=1 Tax=Streptomyces sp. B1-3 TaxID=3141453 RepID=UPI003D286CD2